MLETVLQSGLRPKIYPLAVKFLASISSKRTVVIISSHPQTFLERESLGYDLNGHIHQLCGSVCDKAGIITQMCTDYGLAPSYAVYVGDMISDVRAAKHAGVCMAAITTGYHSREQLTAENPDIVVDSLTELLKHL
ncbi:MAG TPA: HAD hydrolase-like protein [Candidatus Paceibacterota bacterium]|nr:HAD hydrolase-like protein [Candidatus Paceibacterota bacterium]